MVSCLVRHQFHCFGVAVYASTGSIVGFAVEVAALSVSLAGAALALQPHHQYHRPRRRTPGQLDEGSTGTPAPHRQQ